MARILGPGLLINTALALLTVSLSGARNTYADSTRIIVKTVNLELQEVFEGSNIDGGITISSGDHVYYYNTHALRKPFLPASTFKIANALIALQTGVMKNVEEILPWDSVDRGWDKWNTDHNLKSAFRYSAVWFYQEVARRIGRERMQAWVDTLGYGNSRTTGGIDKFWLSGGLRISAYEQIYFLQRLYENNLPLDISVMEAVKDIMLVEQADEFILRGKTGWVNGSNPQVGWFVGWVENSSGVHYFATVILSRGEPGESFKKARKEITKSVLRDLGILPEVEEN